MSDSLPSWLLRHGSDVPRLRPGAQHRLLWPFLEQVAGGNSSRGSVLARGLSLSHVTLCLAGLRWGSPAWPGGTEVVQCLFKCFHWRWRLAAAGQSVTVRLLCCVSPRTGKRQLEKHRRLWQLVSLPFLQHCNPPLGLVPLQPGKKGWTDTRGPTPSCCHSPRAAALALLCSGFTRDFLRGVLGHWHRLGHRHNIRLSHSWCNKKSHVFLSAPCIHRGLFNKERLLAFLCR